MACSIVGFEGILHVCAKNLLISSKVLGPKYFVYIDSYFSTEGDLKKTRKSVFIVDHSKSKTLEFSDTLLEVPRVFVSVPIALLRVSFQRATDSLDMTGDLQS